MALYADKKDFIDAVRQINHKFEQIDNALKQLQTVVDEMKVEATPPTRKAPAKKVAEKA